MLRRTALLALTATAALSACGFRLRGADGRSALPYKTVHLGVAPTAPLGVELRRYIRASGDTTVVSDPKEAEISIDVLSEKRDRATLTLNTQGRIREYTLYYHVRFRVKDNAQRELLEPTEIILKRDISFNESQVIAKEKEEEMLYRDMQSDAVQQILRRVASLGSARAN